MPRTRRSPVRTTPVCKYDAQTGILWMTGRSFYRDLEHAWMLIETGQVPFTLRAIVHTVEGIGVPMVVTGHHLSAWLVDRSWPDWMWHFSTQAMRKSA